MTSNMQYGESIRYDITFNFEFRYNGGLGWRGVWRSDKGQYDYVVDENGTVLNGYPACIMGFM